MPTPASQVNALPIRARKLCACCDNYEDDRVSVNNMPHQCSEMALCSCLMLVMLMPALMLMGSKGMAR